MARADELIPPHYFVHYEFHSLSNRRRIGNLGSCEAPHWKFLSNTKDRRLGQKRYNLAVELKCEEVLVALRQIMRATDLHSKQLKKVTGLTTPQLVVLLALQDSEDISVGALADQVSLSQATVTAILDRLERQQLVYRRRSEGDRRRVNVFLTELGRSRLKDAPAALQDAFVRAFTALEDWEQNLITSALQRVAVMMKAEAIDASPLLEVQPIAETTNTSPPIASSADSTAS